MAASGLIPFFATYAGFITMRACEQVRTFVAYPGLNVKLIGANGGIGAGAHGRAVSHQRHLRLGTATSSRALTAPSQSTKRKSGSCSTVIGDTVTPRTRADRR